MQPRHQLFLVRHGQTEWSRTGRHTGRTDIPLDAVGCVEAERLGADLAAHPFVAVLHSPLARAAETCRLMWPAGATADEDLVEWDYGDYEGLTTAEIRRRRPGWDLFVDGAPGGETAGQVGQRADRVIARAQALAGDVLCVAHGHLLRVLTARWIGLPAVAGRLWSLTTGSWGVLGWERETPVITRWSVPPSPD
jgi:broad specificity phosphatase PhoE